MKKNIKNALPQNPPRLVKITGSIYALKGSVTNLPNINPIISRSQLEDWNCLLCFTPTRERMCSSPRDNKPNDFTGTLVYAVCNKHERNIKTEELAQNNLLSRIKQFKNTIGIPRE